jgi:hypothetical protein
MKRLRSVALLGVIIAVAACVPRPREQPPAPQPKVQQPLPQPPAPPPPAIPWEDAQLTPGTWYYNITGATSQALFGPANSEAIFIVRCDRNRREISLSRAGTPGSNVMTVRTSTSARNYYVTAQREPLPYVSAVLPASDRFLDEMAFSRGRFAVENQGLAVLVLPTWPEPARVVEDCRS